MAFCKLLISLPTVQVLTLARCMLVPGFALGFLIGEFKYIQHGATFTASDFWASGLGKPDARFLVGPPFDSRTNWNIYDEGITATQFYRNVILANIPQLFLSIAYITYNRHLTCMLSAREYCWFAQKPRALRVSGHPQPGQKGAYLLSLPFWYGTTMQVTSALLHYLVSQAIFLANVKVVNSYGAPTAWSLSQVGYSPVGLLSVGVVGSLAAILAFFQGTRRLPADMPLAASCSASISAACHPTDAARDHEVHHHLTKVRWGVETDGEGKPIIAHYDDGRGHTENVGHCTFTHGRTVPPEKGSKYE